MYAFTDAFDDALKILEDLAGAFGMKVQIRMFTQSKQMLNVLTREKRPTDRRLVIDVTVARKANEKFEIDLVELVRGEFNSADEQRNVKSNDVLSHLLYVCLDEIPVEQWITRCNYKQRCC